MSYVRGTFCANNCDSDTRCNVLQLRFGARSSSQTAHTYKTQHNKELSL